MINGRVEGDDTVKTISNKVEEQVMGRYYVDIIISRCVTMVSMGQLYPTIPGPVAASDVSKRRTS